ncbi:hypothetical protein [Hyalangium rubrum]|uniref:Uncharacterized protein n=1 Tax=Hyalangium rubrum TaxID=3103134 RepID=A0ABU5HHB7_9BACT|nr:hypothetical protein [Hyalangium sp. s54d21]MDY7232524.1 hypothetical protein [Hyalangium sp. s54d21]
MTTSTRDSDRDTPMMDASSAATFWNDMFQTNFTFWQSQHSRFFSALDKMREGKYDSAQWMQDVAGSWDAWLTLLASPWQASAGRERQLPTLLFVVDGDAEFIGPTDAPTHVFLPDGVTTRVTDLHPVVGAGIAVRGKSLEQGTGNIDANAHIRAQLSPNRDRVEVSLVDLGRGQSRRKTQGIDPGLYVGAVYATEVATRRPLAIIYVLVEESKEP